MDKDGTIDIYLKEYFKRMMMWHGDVYQGIIDKTACFGKRGMQQREGRQEAEGWEAARGLG